MTVVEVSRQALAVDGQTVVASLDRLPRDKSLTHRGLMFAALAEGASTIHEPLLGEDCLATARIMAELGVTLSIAADRIEVDSRGGRTFPHHNDKTLDCGNSGTTARLLLGLLSGIPSFRGTLIGDSSLSRRPMARVTELIGGGFEPVDRLPITITGRAPQPRAFSFAKASGQVKSALLLHSLSCPGTVTITLPAGGRDHTELFLQRQGAAIETARQGGDEIITFTGPFQPEPGAWRVPADPSSLAFLWVAILTAGKSAHTFSEVLANATRIGGLKVLQRMTGDLTARPEGPSSAEGQLLEPTLAVSCPAAVALKATTTTAEELPTLIDEIPILAVAACFAEGTTRFADLAELRVKESDRLAETYELLHRAGADVAIEGDDLIVTGAPDFKPQPFRYHSEGDHRMVMAAIVLAKSCPELCVIEDYGAVGTSFPDFAPALAAVLA